MMDFGGHMSTGGWILSILGILILVALFVAIIVVVVSSIDSRRGGAPAEAASAREILDRRLALGELTIEQYDELSAALDGDGQSSTAESTPPHPASAS